MTLVVGDAVTVVPWHGLAGGFCGWRGWVVEVSDGPTYRPDYQVKLEGWPHVIGFFLQELKADKE